MPKIILNPCLCAVGARLYNAYVEVEFSDGRLSMHGVVGPDLYGNCHGGAGQCVDEIRAGRPNKEWTREMLDKLCDYWDKYHLNDMRPYCSHQKELGWDELARKEVTLYHYSLNNEASKKQKDAENAALEALRNGKTFTPTEEQVKYANLKYFYDTYEEISGEMSELYKPYKSLHGGITEKKTLGWISNDEYSEGLIGKPCPVCGYKYGTSWKKEDVPEDVIAWLFSLPESKVRPAWI